MIEQNKSKVLKFELSPHDLKIKNLLKEEFLMVEIYAISNIYPNRNKSHFTEEAMKNALPTFYNKPILGAFNKLNDDFKGHDDDGIKYDSEYDNVFFDYGSGQSEIPLGMIRQSDPVEIKKGKDGLDWIVVNAALWTNYSYRQVKKLLKSAKKKISVEVEVTKSYIDEKGIQIIEEFTLCGITILGDTVTEAIPSAHLSIPELLETAVFQKKAQCLSFAYKELDKALGIESDADIKDTFEISDTTNVENEKSEEISMETNQRGGDEKLTYEEKRQLLELALNRRPEGEEEECCYCNWVMDMDDTDVFFHFEGGSFSAPYTIESDEEGHAKAVIDFENKVPVVHSWKAYAKEDEKEPEEDKSEGEKEVEACGEKEEVKGEESCDGKETESCENKEEESCEDKAEESCGDKVEESCGDKAEESVTTEAAEGCEEKEEESCGDKQEESCGDKQEESCDEKQEESCGDKQEESCGDKQDNEAESESCGEAEENKEEGKEEESVISDDTYAEKPIISADTYEETKEEDNADKEKQDECGRFTVNDKEYNAEEFKAEFERISNELVEMTKKFNAVNEKLAEIRNGELYAFACEIVADEHELTEENAANIKDSIKAFCVEGKYATNEEAQEATEHMIADALYAQKKAAKKTGKEFSSTIIKNAVFSTVNETEAGNEETGINKLKNNVAKLKKA